MPSNPFARSVRAAAICAVVLLLAACSTPSAAVVRLEPSLATDHVIEGVQYSTNDGTPLLMDVCLPDAATTSPSATPKPAMVVLHGGGFVDGDRSSGGTRTVCELMAQYGVVGFAIDYSLVPKAKYPTQVMEVQDAIRWLRQPTQVKRFGIDPARIGLFGSSAGAILAQEVATVGSGSLEHGARVRTVISLSGVSDFEPTKADLGGTTPALRKIVLDYLGCTEATTKACPQATTASAIRTVDRTDPPMLIINSSNEIVPVAQADLMAAALRKAGVPVDLVIRPGDAHGFAALDSTARNSVKQFLAAHL